MYIKKMFQTPLMTVIKLGMSQSERLISLNDSARNQMEILKNNNGIKELELLQERINENNRVLIENK